MDACVPGITNVHSFTFDENWQVILGEWHLELWTGDEKLADQRFVVTGP
jgi:hypothetical protein